MHIFEKVLQAKFENGKECSLCHGHHIAKNGTFLENSNLSLSTWIEYISSFIQEKTIREYAAFSNISIPASFNCRHRLLHVMSASNHPDKLQVMIEIDDKTSVISYSVNHYKNCPQFEGLTRKSYRRSRKGHKYKDTVTDEVIMSCTVDRHHHAYAAVGKVGTTALSQEDVKEIYGRIVKEGSVICSDGNFSYRILKESHHIELHAIANKDKYQRGIYHINNINYFHSLIERYLYNHHGIATKYLDEYLSCLCCKYENILNDVSEFIIYLFCCPCFYRLKDYIHSGLLGKLYIYQ